MNRLQHEKSVYLQQHKSNPVDWFAWGPEAFAKAEKEGKCILVSIGYSTCHWCHVMEHESFEDAEVARLLNESFVAIKVDREEHPEVDRFFMDALHAFSPRGGWPLNMFTTPDRQPFFGGTYFPKESFKELLAKIDSVWKTQPAALREQARSVVSHVSEGNVFSYRREPSVLEALRARRRAWLENLGTTQMRAFDPVWGGFGGAPKFPRSHLLTALLRAPQATAREAAFFTLQRIVEGGIHDQLGGGFHRYSTDEFWRVPHFEKMLYDQALLLQTLADAYQLRGDEAFRAAMIDMVDYLEREMRLPNGAFAAAQDADTEGVEGLTFIWTRAEIEAALAGEDAARVEVFLRAYTVEREGNWERHASHGTHVPQGPVNVLARRPDTPREIWDAEDFCRFRAKLLKVRTRRAQPLTDTKALVAWNAWLVTALLRASASVIARDASLAQRLLDSGLRGADFLASCLGEDLSLPHVVYGAERRGRANLEDWASVGAALQAAGVFGGRIDLAAKASRVSEVVDERFRNEQGRLQALERGEDQGLTVAHLEDNDNATPAAISVWAGFALREALRKTSPEGFRRVASDIAALEPVMDRHPSVLPYLLCELGVLDGFALKIPSGAKVDWTKFIGPERFATDFIVAPSEDTRYQLCDFEACRKVSDGLGDLFLS